MQFLGRQPRFQSYCKALFFLIKIVLPFIRGFSSHKPPILRIKNGHALLSKSGEKRGGRGEEGAINFYKFLLSPKGPNEWHNIPF